MPKLSYILLLGILLLLAACTPSEAKIATAIAQTQAAIPPTSTSTNTPLPTPTFTSTPTATIIPSETPIPLLAPIAGTWVGVDKGTVGGKPVPDREGQITIQADCIIGDACGTRIVYVNGGQCASSLILENIENNVYTFTHGPSDEYSSSLCGPGGGPLILQLLPDGTLFSQSDGYNSSGARIKKTGTYTLSD